MAKHWTALGFTKAEAAVARGYILERTDRNFDCWIWLLSTNKGHGQTVYRQSAHRVSYAAFVGPIPSDRCVRHKCGSGGLGCCNPEHLELGTHAENMADKKRDGVRLSASGEEHGKAVLTESAVSELRSRTWTHGDQFKAAASDLGVDESSVRNAVRGKTWKHLPGAQPGIDLKSNRLPPPKWTAANHPRLKYSVETARTAKRLIDFGLSCAEAASWLAVPHSFVRDVKCGRRAL
jgi:hypothetical protein